MEDTETKDLTVTEIIKRAQSPFKISPDFLDLLDEEEVALEQTSQCKNNQF